MNIADLLTKFVDGETISRLIPLVGLKVRGGNRAEVMEKEDDLQVKFVECSAVGPASTDLKEFGMDEEGPRLRVAPQLGRWAH